MRTIDRRGPYGAARSVPIEVAEAWREEALAARRQLEETRYALESTSAALQQARNASYEARAQRPQRDPRDAEVRHELAQARADLSQARRALDEAETELAQTRRALDEARAAPPPPAPPPPAAEDDRVARLAADLANVRRHRDDAVERARRDEKIEGLRALADVYDDLQRSLDANPDRESPWYLGHASILGKVRSLLRQGGAVPVGAVGEPFDPRVHEAVGTAPGPADRIAHVDQAGFQLDDGGLVRPARVRVGDGSAGEER